MAFRLADVGGRAVLVDGDGVHDVEAASGGQLTSQATAALADPAVLHELAAGLADRPPEHRLGDVELGPPVAAPRQVFGIGLNYRTHAAETGAELPEAPMVFTKFPGCLVGPAADIVLVGDRVDYEAELVVVIGAGGRDVPAASAWSAVAGLTVGQDVSDRTLQFAGGGRSSRSASPAPRTARPARGSCPPISLTDPDGLRITCEVDGEVRQDETTADLIFSVAELVAYLSSMLPLFPGDLIFTGTPAGVGAATGDFLRPGQVVRTTIEGVGTLENRCTA